MSAGQPMREQRGVQLHCQRCVALKPCTVFDDNATKRRCEACGWVSAALMESIAFVEAGPAVPVVERVEVDVASVPEAAPTEPPPSAALDTLQAMSTPRVAGDHACQKDARIAALEVQLAQRDDKIAMLELGNRALEMLRKQHNKLGDVFECPQHGRNCTAHAISEVKRMRDRLGELPPRDTAIEELTDTAATSADIAAASAASGKCPEPGIVAMFASHRVCSTAQLVDRNAELERRLEAIRDVLDATTGFQGRQDT